MQALRLLSVMAAIRLNDKPDKIENVLFASLMDGTLAVSSGDRSVGASTDPLASSMWEEVNFSISNDCAYSLICIYINFLNFGI